MRELIKIMDPEEFRAELEREGIRTIRRDYIKRTDKNGVAGGYLVLTAEKDDVIYRHEALLIVQRAILWDSDYVQEKCKEQKEKAEKWLREFFKDFTIRPGIIVR